MQRERIQRRTIVRKHGVPGNLPLFRNQSQGRSGQRRHVQRLANVADSVWPAGVLVNDKKDEAVEATLKLDGTSGPLLCASPEQPNAAPCSAKIRIAPRSVVVAMESK